MSYYLNRKNWINYGRWVQPTLSGCFWCYWNETDSVKEIFPNSHFNNNVFLDGNTLVSKNDQKKVDALLNSIFKNKDSNSPLKFPGRKPEG